LIYFIDILLYRLGGLTRRTFVFGPMTDDDGVGLHADAERCRRDLDKNVHVSGPVTDSAISLAVERCRRNLGDSLVVLGFCLADVIHGPAFNAEGRLAENLDVGVGDFQTERRKHVILVVLDRLEAPI